MMRDTKAERMSAAFNRELHEQREDVRAWAGKVIALTHELFELRQQHQALTDRHQALADEHEELLGLHTALTQHHAMTVRAITEFCGLGFWRRVRWMFMGRVQW